MSYLRFTITIFLYSSIFLSPAYTQLVPEGKRCDSNTGHIFDPDNDCGPCTNGMEELLLPAKAYEDYRDQLEAIRENLKQYLEDQEETLNVLRGKNEGISLGSWTFNDISEGPDISNDLEYIDNLIEDLEAYRNRFDEYPAQSSWMTDWIEQLEELKDALQAHGELDDRARHLLNRLNSDEFADFDKLNFDCCPKSNREGRFNKDQLNGIDGFMVELRDLIDDYIGYRTDMTDLCAHFMEMLKNTLRIRAAEEQELTERRDQYANGLISFLFAQLSNQFETGIVNVLEEYGQKLNAEQRAVIEALSSELSDRVESSLSGGAQGLATGEARQLLDRSLNGMPEQDRAAFMAIAGPIMDKIANQVVEKYAQKALQNASGKFLLRGLGGIVTLPLTLFEQMVTVPLYLWADRDLKVLQGAYDRILTAQILAIRMSRDKLPLGVDEVISGYFDQIGGQQNREIVICLEAREPLPQNKEAFKNAFLNEAFNDNPPETWVNNDHYDMLFNEGDFTDNRRPYLHFPMHGVRWIARFDCYCGIWEEDISEPQKPVYTVSPKGTGETTGHIADIIVHNAADQAITTRAQSFYIPSDHKFQSYVGRIPSGITIPPDESVDIPVYGVCTDPRKPPVPEGTSMIPVEEWITIDDIPRNDLSSPSNIVTIVPAEPLARFDPDQIDEIMASDGFKPSKEPSTGIRVTWPGTEKPISGTFDVADHPEEFAPVIVEAVHRLEDAADALIESGDITTPFSTHPGKEKEALLQQSTWIVVGQLLGEPYTREDFEDNVYEQFESNTGNPVTTLPEEEKKKVDSGVEEFWNAFTATGVEAKVLKDDAGVLISSRNDDCQCDTLSFTLSRLESKGLYENITTHTTTTFSAAGNEKLEDVILSPDDFEEIDLKVSNVYFKCSCMDSVKCDFYSGTRMTEETKSKYDGNARSSSTAGAASISDESQDGEEFTFTLTPDADIKNAYINIKLKAYCMNETCDRKTCTRRFQIQFKREQEEED